MTPARQHSPACSKITCAAIQMLRTNQASRCVCPPEVAQTLAACAAWVPWPLSQSSRASHGSHNLFKTPDLRDGAERYLHRPRDRHSLRALSLSLSLSLSLTVNLSLTESLSPSLSLRETATRSEL